jgi:hypothetical protein
MKSKDIAKHLFQIGLHKEFGLAVIVNFTLNERHVDVSMMRQTTLDEFGDENLPALMGKFDPMWTDAIINLSPKILWSTESLIAAYEKAHGIIKEALKRGKVIRS